MHLGNLPSRYAVRTKIRIDGYPAASDRPQFSECVLPALYNLDRIVNTEMWWSAGLH